MKQKTRNILCIVLKKGISFLLIAFIFVGAFSAFVVINTDNLIYKKFFSSRVENQTILELWLISKYESGVASKESHLERVAIEFEKQNKGAYILIQEMTEDECKIKLDDNEAPDIFCFSGCVAGMLEPYLAKLEEQENVKEVLLNAARNKALELKSYPYSLGGYALISTINRLESANCYKTENMLFNVYSLGYQKKLKKSTKNTYSVVYGTKNGNFVQSALNEEAKNRGVELNKISLSYDEKVREMTSYNAYTSFVYGDSVMLLGTQRDLARIQSREKSGREDGFVVDFFSHYSDIVDFVGVAQTDSENNMKLARAFSKFLISEESQKSLSKIGLFPTIKMQEYIYESGYFLEMEKCLKSLSLTESIFT